MYKDPNNWEELWYWITPVAQNTYFVYIGRGDFFSLQILGVLRLEDQDVRSVEFLKAVRRSQCK